MRADLPARVAAAIERCEGPSLVFDLARVEANALAIAAAARAHGITPLFAAKSCPHPAVRAIAARVLSGFDAASSGEVAELAAFTIGTLSIVDPGGRAGATADHARATRIIVGCETVAQVSAAPLRAAIAIRLSASIVPRDPAVGAVQDGSGHRRSRFGLDLEPGRQRDVIAAMVRAADGRAVGVHVHHGAVSATTGERFAASAHAALAAARAAGLEPAFVNAGGAWHAVADLAAAFAELRAAVPPATEILVEPGRAVTRGAGFATGRVIVARELDDRALRITDVSRICHLRWSTIDLVGPAPHPGTGHRVVVVGPTCFEEDVLGEWTIDPLLLAVGARITLRDVSGYALAWNAPFGGVPAASVVAVD